MQKLTTAQALQYFYSLDSGEQYQITKDAIKLNLSMIEYIETLLYYDILDNE